MHQNTLAPGRSAMLETESEDAVIKDSYKLAYMQAHDYSGRHAPKTLP